MAMGLWKNWFPIALAILWIVMAAMAIVDFASFNAATAPRRPLVKQEHPVHSALSQGRQTALRQMVNEAAVARDVRLCGSDS
jgi:hypothetical protein